MLFPDLAADARPGTLTVYSESYRDATRASVMEVVVGAEQAIGYLADAEQGDAPAVAALLLFTSNGGGEAVVEHPLPSSTVNTSVRDLREQNPVITDAIDSLRPSARIALTRAQCIELASTLLCAVGIYPEELFDIDEPASELYVDHGDVMVEC